MTLKTNPSFAQGNSKISVSDYAIAMLDVLEGGEHINKRIGVAY